MFPHNLFVLAMRNSVSPVSSHPVFRGSLRKSTACTGVRSSRRPPTFKGTRQSIFGKASLFNLVMGVSIATSALLSTPASAASASSRSGIKSSMTTIHVESTALPSLAKGNRGGALAQKDGVLFRTGGDEKNARRGLVERFDPDVGSWELLTDRVVPRSFGGAVVVGEWLVIVGGRSKLGAEPITERVHLETGRIVRGAPLPTPRWSAGVALHDGQIFVAGGTHGWARLAVVEAYDVELDQWLAKAPLSVARDAALVEVDGELYALGGYGGPDVGPTRVVERFDGEVFVASGSLALAMSAFAVAVDVGDNGQGRAILFGDFLNANRVIAFTPKTGRTQLVDAKFTPRRQAAAVATPTGIVVVGGREISGELSVAVERFTLR